jgi:hypothetical protein
MIGRRGLRLRAMIVGKLEDAWPAKGGSGSVVRSVGNG